MTAPSIREALKPCPFCGSDRVSSAHQRDGRVIGCAGCGARVGAFQPGAEEKATEKWNTRTTPAPPQDVVERIALDAETIQTLLDLLNPLHGSLDEQTYNEKIKENFDAPLWNTFVDAPEPGRKFVALYNDGSGARMFYAFDGGVIDCDGDELYGFDLAEQSYGLWAYLPDNLEFWCETRAEDPMTLKVIR